MYRIILLSIVKRSGQNSSVRFNKFFKCQDRIELTVHFFFFSKSYRLKLYMCTRLDLHGANEQRTQSKNYNCYYRTLKYHELSDIKFTVIIWKTVYY